MELSLCKFVLFIAKRDEAVIHRFRSMKEVLLAEPDEMHETVPRSCIVHTH